MILRDLVADLEITDCRCNPEIYISGIAYDSRKVEQDFLFVAIEGFQTDGHLFIEDAVKRGAVAVVLQKEEYIPASVPWIRIPDTRRGLALISARYYDFPCDKLDVVGVTGTNGKTTTTYMIKAIWEEAGVKTGLFGTVQNMAGEKVLPVGRTTPESLDLQKMAAGMLEDNVGALVMEVSSHALVLNRVEGCPFNAAVFTNITQDHLDFHRDMQEYIDAKSKLFKNAGIAVVNIDSSYAGDIINNCRGKVITYGVQGEADIIARDIYISPGGVSFTVECGGESSGIELKLTGMFNVYNALGAFGAGVALGIDNRTIKRGLENLKGVPGRFQLIEEGQDFAVIVDYAHSPDGLENILTTAREFTRGRLITVFGCGGDRDRTKRPLMGKIGTGLSDLAVITSDNPRTEDPGAIIEDIITEGAKKIEDGEYVVIIDRRSAIRYALETAQPGDVVIIAGKGHENYQEVGGERMHFDDCEEAVKILKELGGAEN